MTYNVRETKHAVRTTSRLRGRWYVTRHDRNILRRCGWLLDTVVKHSHWDLEDGVRVGGTIVTQIPTIDQGKVFFKNNFEKKKLYIYVNYRAINL